MLPADAKCPRCKKRVEIKWSFATEYVRLVCVECGEKVEDVNMSHIGYSRKKSFGKKAAPIVKKQFYQQYGFCCICNKDTEVEYKQLKSVKQLNKDKLRVAMLDPDAPNPRWKRVLRMKKGWEITTRELRSTAKIIVCSTCGEIVLPETCWTHATQKKESPRMAL